MNRPFNPTEPVTFAELLKARNAFLFAIAEELRKHIGETIDDKMIDQVINVGRDAYANALGVEMPTAIVRKLSSGA